MVIDIKDRHSFAQLQKYLKKDPKEAGQMPQNFRDGLEIGTFDPEVVMEVKKYNDAHEEKKIPITLHFIPLMRYADGAYAESNAKTALQVIEQNAQFIRGAARAIGIDQSNDALAGIGDADFHTTYDEFRTASRSNPNADHVLALWNPLKEIQQEIIDAVKDSGGYFSFPYDAKYIEWINSAANRTGVDISQISTFNIASHDDLHDAYRNGVGRMVHDVNV